MRQHQIVAAVVRQGDAILLVRQQGADDPRPTWALPGGVVEDGELLHEALARELREETGLALRRVGALLYVAQTHVTHMTRGVLRGEAGARAEAYVATAFVFDVAGWIGEIASDDPDHVVSAARFFPRAEAIALLDQLGARVMREPIVAYLRGEAAPGAVWLYRRQDDGTDALISLS
ncbi:MAG: hypothetical protein OJF49_002439 [Ktedonobacterales bacterium]|nr:MAG: hypothetical protein OJF49_002439 [Ktedonobacterales bacterium]